MRAGVDECSKAKTRITRGSSQGGAQARAGWQKARKRKRARRANAVLKGTAQATASEWANRLGYFLNFHHLKPEAFSGFLR